MRLYLVNPSNPLVSIVNGHATMCLDEVIDRVDMDKNRQASPNDMDTLAEDARTLMVATADVAADIKGEGIRPPNRQRMPSCKLQDFVCGKVQIAQCAGPLPHPGSAEILVDVWNALHLRLGTTPA